MALLLAASAGGCSDGPSLEELRQTARFMPASACVECHEEETRLWQGSYHDLAMQPATDSTVVGDFNDVSFEHYGRTSTFSRRNGQFFVRTENRSGEFEEFEIAYTFGVYPLQQYLIAFPGGRYQALSICWDDRPASEDGQRWFHLYPDEPIPADDPLHWTRSYQNWNYMCAECHSTNLDKGYDLESDTYATTWSSVNLACDACHGPGSEHIAWAKAVDAGKARDDDPYKGLLVKLGDQYGGTWQMNTTTGIAKRSTPLLNDRQVEACARCHSRRGVIAATYEYGAPLLDTHRPELLEENLYFADGQILDEVYVYGSFVQSKMHAAGVVCSDCHDPHSTRLKADGNGVCGTCHLPTLYDSRDHHFHDPTSAGGQCVACHMPARNYMVVDPRRDHSMRVPRPDLSARIGAPDACTGCHADSSQAWAAQAVAKWYGPEGGQQPHFGDALFMGRAGHPEGESALRSVASSDTIPAIARATAITLLRRYPTTQSLETARRGLSDADPIVRVAALGALEMLSPEQRPALAFALLDDPIRAVRLEAARILAATPSSALDETRRERLRQATDDYAASLLVNADRPEAHMQLGVLNTARGRLTRAEEAYRTALRLNPDYVQTYVNLADLYRMQGRDDLGEQLLREATARAPEVAEIHHALGLLLARDQRLDEALSALGRAATLEPDVARFAYVHAIALNTAGQTETAIDVLERALDRNPFERDILMALVTINRDRGNDADALRFGRRLATIQPDDQAIQRLIGELESRETIRENLP